METFFYYAGFGAFALTIPLFLWHRLNPTARTIALVALGLTIPAMFAAREMTLLVNVFAGYSQGDPIDPGDCLWELDDHMALVSLGFALLLTTLAMAALRWWKPGSAVAMKKSRYSSSTRVLLMLLTALACYEGFAFEGATGAYRHSTVILASELETVDEESGATAKLKTTAGRKWAGRYSERLLWILMVLFSIAPGALVVGFAAVLVNLTTKDDPDKTAGMLARESKTLSIVLMIVLALVATWEIVRLQQDRAQLGPVWEATDDAPDARQAIGKRTLPSSAG